MLMRLPDTPRTVGAVAADGALAQPYTAARHERHAFPNKNGPERFCAASKYPFSQGPCSK
jgi:hypothetical protein